jgi:hypothetical protein
MVQVEANATSAIAQAKIRACRNVGIILVTPLVSDDYITGPSGDRLLSDPEGGVPRGRGRVISSSMRQFLLGVLVASVVWAGVLLAQAAGVIDIFGDGGDEAPVVPDAGVETAVASESEGDEQRKRRGKKRRPGRRRKSGGAAYAAGDGVAGDEIGGPGSQELAMDEAGGQQQLSEAQIDRGIDTVWHGIQRCLVLVPSDLPATGRVVLGMRIAPSGRVTRVGLRGPNPIVQGESGACIRRAVKSIEYPSFDGPEMVAHYPIVFE